MKMQCSTDLRIADGLAHLGSEGPVLEQQSGDGRKWDAEECHENVAHSEVDNEVVSDGPHAWTRLYYMTYKAVTRQCKQEDEAVHYVHCCLIIRGRVDTAWSIVAGNTDGNVEGGVIAVSVIVVEVHGVLFSLHHSLVYINQPLHSTRVQTTVQNNTKCIRTSDESV
jgi:hypothetical protein